MFSWFRSKLSRQAAPQPAGLFLGTTIRGSKPLVLSDSALRAHVAMSGRGGAGRSTLLRQMLGQQTRDGRGWVYVDPAGDEGIRDHLASVASEAGRLGEFYVLDLADPDNSNTYDVLRAGTADARAQRILTLFPPAGTEEGQLAAKQLGDVLALVFDALDAAGKSVGLHELADMLSRFDAPEVRGSLLAGVPAGHQAGAALQAKLDELDADGRAPRAQANLSGAAGVLYALARTRCSTILSHPAPEIDFEDVLARGKMCYIRLPLMEKDSIVLKLERIVLKDVISAIQARGQVPGDQRPPFLVAMDSFPEYGLAESLSPPLPDAVYAQARGMGVGLIPAVASCSWDKVCEAYRTEALIGNTFTKVYFQQDDSAHLAQMHPGLKADALSSLGPGRFIMCQGSSVVEGRVRYTDTGTPPGFTKRTMPVVESLPRWHAPPLRMTP